MSEPQARIADQARVLIVRLDNMGDVLMSTPAIHAIRAHRPDAHLTLLASPSGSQIAHHLTDVDEVLCFRAPWVKSRPDERHDDELALLRRLSADPFDAAIILTSATQSALPMALLAKMAGIPIRLAYSHENPYQLLTHWVKDTDQIASDMRHEVDRLLALVQALGVPGPADDRLRFHVTAADEQEALQVLQRHGIDPSTPFVVIHPGATATSRRYPAERFGQVADQLMDAGVACVFCAGPDETALVKQAAAHMRHTAIDCAGQLTIGGLAATLRLARLLIANNSGATHLAAAVGTPVVCLYALTNPQHTPWRVAAQVINHWVDCGYCLQSVCPHTHHACLRQVSPERVVQAAQHHLRSQAWNIPLPLDGAPWQPAGAHHGASCQV